MGRLEHLLNDANRALVAGNRSLPAVPPEDLATRRAGGSALFQTLGVQEKDFAGLGLALEEIKVPGLVAGDPEVLVQVFRPASLANGNGTANGSVKAPAILFIHGGGFIVTTARDWQGVAAEYAVAVGGAVVFSVDFRNAPEHPYPAGLNDCYAALVYMSKNADALGIDPARIAVFGQSGGGGLTASTVLKAKLEGLNPPVAAQFPIYPMIDDSNTTQSSKDIVDFAIWDRATNIHGACARQLRLASMNLTMYCTRLSPFEPMAAWKCYLGDKPADIVAAPARATVEDVAGLPWTYIDVTDLDLFRDESIAYASKLMAAGVGVELHVFQGGIHAWDVG